MALENQQKQQGFTLVEIAIVLVIIGLLLGGVLKGQELINNAKQRSMITDFNGLKVAYYSFQDRYGYVPGDNATPASRDGQIATINSNADSGTAVVGTFFKDLFDAGFISVVNPTPDASFASHYRAAYDNTNATDGVIPDKNQICIIGVVNLLTAQAIDNQLDDGIYNTGLVRGSVDYTATNATSNVCMEI